MSDTFRNLAVNGKDGQDAAEAISGKKIFCYRNLHSKNRVLWSLRENGLVIGYATGIVLADVKLVVWQGGRQRVLREKKKNIHAFCSGTVSSPELYRIEDMEPVTYNPYHCPEEPTGSFRWKFDNTPVLHVKAAILTDTGKVFALRG